MDNLGNGYLSKKILITGASGYIGNNFLKENYYKNLVDSYEISKIINLAGFVPKKKQEYNSIENCKNEVICKNIIKFFNCDFFHFSTQAVYENNLESKITEDSIIIEPTSRYAISKFKSEIDIMNNYNGKFAILRIPGIFGGSRKNGIIYEFIKSLYFTYNNYI